MVPARARDAPPGSPERDFYVWSDTDDRSIRDARIIFVDSEALELDVGSGRAGVLLASVLSSPAGSELRQSGGRSARFSEVIDFWLDLGVDGFRLDAVPYLVEREGTSCENLPETHAMLKAIRRHIDARWPHRMLLAEANQLPADVRAYFGDGDECHMAYHFPLMPRMFMALHLEDRHADRRDHGADAGHSGRSASGRCSCGTTMS